MLYSLPSGRRSRRPARMLIPVCAANPFQNSRARAVMASSTCSSGTPPSRHPSWNSMRSMPFSFSATRSAMARALLMFASKALSSTLTWTDATLMLGPCDIDDPSNQPHSKTDTQAPPAPRQEETGGALQRLARPLNTPDDPGKKQVLPYFTPLSSRSPHMARYATSVESIAASRSRERA